MEMGSEGSIVSIPNPGHLFTGDNRENRDRTTADYAEEADDA